MYGLLESVFQWGLVSVMWKRYNFILIFWQIYFNTVLHDILMEYKKGNIWHAKILWVKYEKSHAELRKN